MKYSEAVDYLYNLQFFGIKLGLENTKLFLGHVNCNVPKAKIIHIAGTNGKGSTATVISKVAEEHGYNVGLYTSPHILDFRERIRINGRVVSEQYVIDFVLSHKDFIDCLKLTFFEVTTVMAVNYFCDENVDLIVLETGMGGRLDATNCFLPKATVITNVSMDHQEYLGDTIEKVVAEKAGIVKECVPCFCGSQDSYVAELVKKQCAEQSSEYVGVLVDNVDDTSLVYNGTKYSSRLLGRHQQLNAKLGLAVCDHLFPLNPETTQKALDNIRWAGRLEKWGRFPNAYLDVSHNPAGVRETVSTLKNIYRHQKLITVFSFLDDKDSATNLELLKPISSRFYFYPLNNKRSTKEVVSFENTNVYHFRFDTIKHFLELNSDETVLFIGSHYLLEDLLKRVEEE